MVLDEPTAAIDATSEQLLLQVIEQWKREGVIVIAVAHRPALVAAADHPSFTPEILAQLKTFLESADLVKFAGQEATPAMTDAATANAQTYIRADAQRIGKEEGERKKEVVG